MTIQHPEVADSVRERYLSPEQVCGIIPGMTQSNLRQLRYTGKGPRFLKPSPRVVVYSEASIREWLAASERTITGSAVA